MKSEIESTWNTGPTTSVLYHSSIETQARCTTPSEDSTDGVFTDFLKEQYQNQELQKANRTDSSSPYIPASPPPLHLKVVVATPLKTKRKHRQKE